MSKETPVPLLQGYLDDLLNDRITAIQAVRLVRQAVGDKPAWQQTWWKKERAKLIGSACEVCGSTKQPLVLQHLSHPPKLVSLIQRQSVTWHDWLTANPYPVPPSEQLRKRDACPHCGHINIRHRKKDGAYICAYPKCKRVITPPFPQVVDPHHIAEIHYEHYLTYKAYLKECNSNREPDKQSVLIWIGGQIKYLSLVDTKTFCKKCAYLMDKPRFFYR